jgi:hypothetical protein
MRSAGGIVKAGAFFYAAVHLPTSTHMVDSIHIVVGSFHCRCDVVPLLHSCTVSHHACCSAPSPLPSTLFLPGNVCTLRCMQCEQDVRFCTASTHPLRQAHCHCHLILDICHAYILLMNGRSFIYAALHPTAHEAQRVHAALNLR